MPRILFLGFLALIVCLASGCDSSPPSDIRFGLNNSVVSLDPRFATDATSSRLCRLLYRALVKFDEAFQPIPDLASWRVDGPQKYVFTLNDALFHDGSQITADDVVATFESILDRKIASPHRGSLAAIARVYATDRRTIVFELTRADPLFPGLLTIGIMPKQATLATDRNSASEINGSGYLRLVGQWTDKFVQLERLSDGARVSFEVILDPTVRALKLINNEIDILQSGLAPEIVAWLEKQDGISAFQYPGTTYSYLGLNLRDPVLAHPKIRQALAHAIDRKEIAKYLFAGRARLANSIFPPEHWVSAGSLAAINYNPDKAKRLLAEMGYDFKHPLSLTYKTSSDMFRLRIATVIQDQLSRVGVNVDIQSYDWGTFYGDIKAGRFQMFSLSWVGLKLPDIFRYVFHSDSMPPEGANRGGYSSQEVDALIVHAEEAVDLETKLADYRQIQALLLEELPYVPLWYEDHIVVMRNDIQGYHVGLDGNYDALIDAHRGGRDGG